MPTHYPFPLFPGLVPPEDGIPEQYDNLDDVWAWHTNCNWSELWQVMASLGPNPRGDWPSVRSRLDFLEGLIMTNYFKLNLLDNYVLSGDNVGVTPWTDIDLAGKVDAHSTALCGFFQVRDTSNLGSILALRHPDSTEQCQFAGCYSVVVGYWSSGFFVVPISDDLKIQYSISGTSSGAFDFRISSMGIFVPV
jgi:hypothetical protein